MEKKEEKKGSSLNVVMAIVQGWSATIYPFMRRGLGKNNPGMMGFIGLGWLMLWVLYTRANGLLWIIPLYLLGALFHRLGNTSKGVHTNYGGEPVLAMKLFRFKDEWAAKRIGEPLISLLAGMALIGCGFDEGKYFAFGAVALIANQVLIDLYDQRRIDDLRDGKIEGQYLMDKAR